MVTPVANMPSALRSSRGSSGCGSTGPVLSLIASVSNRGMIEPLAQRDLAVERGGDVPVERVVAVRRMHVAERALDVAKLVESVAARGLEQQIDGVRAEPCCIG